MLPIRGHQHHGLELAFIIFLVHAIKYLLNVRSIYARTIARARDAEIVVIQGLVHESLVS